MPTVQDILAKKGSQVASIPGDSTVLEAAREMNRRHIGALVVVKGDKVEGIFTERDILNRVVAQNLSPAEVRVSDVMTTPVACCKRSTKIAECQSVMTAKRIRHLPVVEDGTLMGIISVGDILAYEVDRQQSTIEYLHEYLYGTQNVQPPE